MEVAVISIAIILGVWTLMLLVLFFVAVFLGFRTLGTLKRLEGLLTEVQREALPTLNSARQIGDDLKEVSRTLRNQVGRSEYLVESTLRSVNETATRVRETITGLSLVLNATGKLLSLFSGGSKK